MAEISNTHVDMHPVISEVTEKVMHIQIHSCFTEHNLFNANQNQYYQKHSTF